MKRLFLLFMIFVLSLSAYAETFKFQTIAFSIKFYNEKTDTWDEWSEWDSSSLLVVLNSDKDRIDIYSSEPQQFDIYDAEETTDDGSGDRILKMRCVDKNGLKCTVRIRIIGNGEFQLYVYYNDVKYVYSMESKD